MTFEDRARELVSKMTLAEKIAQMQHDAPAIERLNVPAYNWWNESLHGVARAGVATVFPQSIAMAASFNTELMNKVATAISDEARAKYNEFKKFGYTQTYQGLTCWSPNINIFRDPRWGRGHETYGEDPYLTARMGTEFVRGMQGKGKYRKTDATLKHFVVHSGPEGSRQGFNVKVGKKDLYETYLWAFKYCIDNADPSAVMGAYNAVNGEPCCVSKTLLTDILRDELGFKGYVVSDCGAVCNVRKDHKYTESDAESAAMAVNNGCELNCGVTYKWLKVAVSIGLITEETITEACVKLFTARFRLGMFDDDCEYDKIPFEVIDCEEHRALNRTMAQEGMVLLKNDGTLPIKDAKTIAVIGPNADDTVVLMGNYNGTASRYSTLLRGIQDATDAKVIYARGCHLYEKPTRDFAELPTNEAIIAAQKADVVIMCMGINPHMEGEAGDPYNGDASGDKTTIDLPPVQMELVEKVIATGKPVVFVNVSGSCMNLAYAKENCNAVIQCFYPGAEGGNALADVLFGKVSPSGRLPITFYETLDDLPDFEDYSMENRTYKFYKGTPVYEFGYGLTYSDIEEKWLDDDTVEISNKGEYDVNYSVLKFEYIPHKNLCGIKKQMIKSGETVTVKF